MAELKTKPNKQSVAQFIKQIDDEQKREDSKTIIKIMEELTKAKPVMWGPSIIGFGTLHYKYESGREGDWFLTGFSPRKQNLTLYIMSGFDPHPDVMDQLGKYKTGKSCLYIKKLEDIDLKILKKLIRESIKAVKKSKMVCEK